nr:phosphopantetheine-binding protein [Pseudoalteromonas sp. NEC-BIFX-2020_015]
MCTCFFCISIRKITVKITYDVVIDVIAEVLELDKEEVTVSSSVVDDLGADSLDLVDISFSLGKKLKIKMPTKTTLIIANELCSDEKIFTEHGKLTASGVDLLINSPSHYSRDEIGVNLAITNLLSLTTVKHWFSLASEVYDHPDQNGDQLLQEYIEQFCASNNIELINVPA